MKTAAALVLAIAVFARSADAQAADSVHSKTPAADSAPKLSLGAFVDSYYAWDFNRPHNFDRAYTTQPARHAEFNINLAFVEAVLSGPRYRGRLALQFGTSVQANYASEPRLGSVSGPGVSQFLQEATVGYQARPSLWIDAGIFFAHLGYESWISSDNLAYSRSFVADFSPYYEAGIKATWAATPKLTAIFCIVNGWQNVANYNTPPAAGVRFDFVASPKLTLTYDGFVGNAAPDSARLQLRVYHDVIAQYNASDRWQFAAVYSLGTQSRTTPSGGTASWWGTTVIAKRRLTDAVALVGRAEHYSDPGQVIVITGVREGFQTSSASLGADVKLAKPLLWRTELRVMKSRGAIWPLNANSAHGPNDAFLVSSLSLRI
jgi:hypothetical protein